YWVRTSGRFTKGEANQLLPNRPRSLVPVETLVGDTGFEPADGSQEEKRISFSRTGRGHWFQSRLWWAILGSNQRTVHKRRSESASPEPAEVTGSSRDSGGRYWVRTSGRFTKGEANQLLPNRPRSLVP